MFLKFQPFFIITETPVHAGSGSELGIVDLPIQRERHTAFPKIEGSGLKGCIREAFESLITKENGKRKLIDCAQSKKLKQFDSAIEEIWKETKDGKEEIKKNKKGEELINYDKYITYVYGPEDGDAHAGSIAFTDARTLLFPVKSLKGVFAWITCPAVLERFKEDMRIAGKTLDNNWKKPKPFTVPKQSSIIVSSKIVLEEYAFDVEEDENITQIAKWLSSNIFPQEDTYKYWREKMEKDIVILSDDDFTEFVKTSTEVITRPRISSETGTVKSGALWTEEYLPQDTILYSIAMASPIRISYDNKKEALKGNNPKEEAKIVINFFNQGLPEILHLGGNQTIGKGIVIVNFLDNTGGEK